MWWWQSVALAGALSFGASVPADHFTACASALRARVARRPAAAAPDAVFRRSRRVKRMGVMRWPPLDRRRASQGPERGPLARGERVAVDVQHHRHDRVVAAGGDQVDHALLAEAI